MMIEKKKTMIIMSILIFILLDLYRKFNIHYSEIPNYNRLDFLPFNFFFFFGSFLTLPDNALVSVSSKLCTQKLICMEILIIEKL